MIGATDQRTASTSGATVRDRQTTPRPRVAIVRFQTSEDNDLAREARALADAGYDVDAFCVGRPGEPATEVAPHQRITYRRVPVDKRRGSALGYLDQYTRWLAGCTYLLARHGLRRPYEAVLVATLPDHQVLAALLPKLRGSRVVVFFKEPAKELFDTLLGGKAGKAVGLTTQLAWRLADHNLCVTDEHRARYLELGVPADKIEVINNSSEPGRWPEVAPEAIDPSEFVAVCHGTMEERWGHEIIVRAAAEAVERLPNLRVVFTGSGTFSPSVDALIKELGLSGRVENRGWVSLEDLAALLRRADVGLVSQLESPYSNLVHTGKMFDFFQFDVPVISSDLKATRADFDGSCVFYPSTDPAALADALVEVEGDPALRQRLRASAREKLQTFGWDAQRDRFVEAVIGYAPAVESVAG